MITLRPDAPDLAGVSGLRGARNAAATVFVVHGFCFASWASRIPQLRDALAASPAVLGLVLLSVGAGSVIALPLAGMVVTRWGPGRTIAAMVAVLAAGLATVGLGYRAGVGPVMVGLLAVGFAAGTWDVAMNVEGAEVERRLSRAVMPRFHAGFSIGTVMGALIGAAMVGLGVGVTLHLLVVAGLAVAVVVPAVRGFLPTSPVEPSAPAPRHPLRAWTESRTLLLGVFILSMGFIEGTATDWLALAILDGYRSSPVTGPLTLALFLAAMTLGRWFGPGLLDRFGRVPVVRVSVAVALVGLVLVVFGQFLPVAMAGAALWGLGTAMGFPVGMSAAADDPSLAAARVSVVASIGYTSYLAGPPLVGLLGEHLGVLRALLTVAALLAVTLLASGFTRPLPARR